MLIAQFIGEAILTSLLSLVVAVLLIYLMLPWFNSISGKTIQFNILNSPSLILGMLGLGLFVGLLAGSYPSLVLSSFKPVDVLKGDRGNTGSSQFLRKSLVVIQFVVSITLIICIGIVHKQLNYIENKDLGFSKEQILTADVDFRQFNKLEAFANELERNPEIIATSMIGGSIPGEEALVENAFVAEGETDEEQQFFSAMFVQYNFEKIIDLEFLQGHAFRQGSSVDSMGFIINESAAKALGYQGEVVGRTIRTPNNNASGEIIGLVKDFNYRPLYEPIKPLVIRLGGGKLMVKMQSEDLRGTIAKVDELWQSQFGEFPFRYSFMDDNFEQLYTKENKFSKTIQYFSILAVFIACLGLLGLSSYATESRRKEIGIRKVNGASTFTLVMLLSKNFSRLVFIAFLIAVPVAYYFGELWLSNFAYRIAIGPDLFIIAGLIAFVLALLTVSFHTFRAARSNPVEAIRYE
jgi:putative ABC transport system permease protein